MSEEFQSDSLLDALLAHGIHFRRSVSDPNECSIQCPFCSETRFRLSFNIANDKALCFNCSWKSRQATEDLAEALDLGVLRVSQDVPDRGEMAHGTVATLPDDFVLLDDQPRGALYKKARDYLHRRGVEGWQ